MNQFSRRTRSVTLSLIIAIGWATSLLAAEPAPERCNIVLILADDLGYGDLGCYGATKIKTPQIDRLASEGRRFTDAHSAAAVCTSSRYALLMGEYPFRKNIWAPLPLDHPLWIDTDRLTLPGMLKRQGYATACFGKWHLGFGRTTTDWNRPLGPGPVDVGFDHYFGLPYVSSGPPFVYVENDRVVGLDPADPFILRQGKTPPAPSPIQPFPAKHGTDRWAGARRAHELYRDEELGSTLTAKAIEWIKSLPANTPFFLHFATPHIHHPFTPSARFQGSSECGRYGDFVEEFDALVGELLKTLDDLGLRDNTLVIVTSDNGGMLNENGQDAWRAGHRMNGPLLGFKFDAWEGGHRVPFVARWPGKIPPASISDRLICQIDLFATFAALTGATLDERDAPDSFNVLPSLTGDPKQPIRDHLIVAPLAPENLALRQDQWIYIGGRGGGGFRGSRPGDHDLGGPAALQFAGQTNSDVANGRLRPGVPPRQLYDLATDPGESRNLAQERPELADELASRLARLKQMPRTAPISAPPGPSAGPAPPANSQPE